MAPVDSLTPAQQDLENSLAAEQRLHAASLPPDPQLVLERGRCLERLGRMEEAMAACNEAAGLISAQGLADSGEVASLRAFLYHRMDRIKDCEAACAEAEQLISAAGLPRSWEIARIRGMAMTAMGQYEQGLALTQEALRLCREQGVAVHPGIHNMIGAACALLGRLAESITAFDEAEGLTLEQGQPVHPGLVSNRGQLLTDMGRFSEALAEYERAEQMFEQQGLPLMVDFLMSKGRCLGLDGRFAEAMETYTRADLRLQEMGSSGNWNLHFARAETMHNAGQIDDAIAELCSAIPMFKAQSMQPPAFLMETLRDWMAPRPDKLVAEQRASQPAAVAPVPDNEKKYDTFICYRRDPGLPHSMLLKNYLDVNGKTVFRDQDDLHSGRFEDDLIEAIRHSRHMVVLLTPDFFSRCMSDEKDVARREIACALHHGTHIIPVMMEGFTWPAEDELSADICSICGINAMSHSSEFYAAFIDKLLRWMGE